MLNLSSISASEARANLYNLIKTAGSGVRGYEIRLRGSESVILLSKSEVSAWLETIDILNNRSEITAIRKARKEKKAVSHDELKKKFGI